MEFNLNDLLDVGQRMTIDEFLDKFNGVFAGTRLLHFLETLDSKIVFTIENNDSFYFDENNFLKDFKYRFLYESCDLIVPCTLNKEDKKLICLYISKNKEKIDKYFQFENVKLVSVDDGHQISYRLAHSLYKLKEYEKEHDINGFKFDRKEEIYKDV